MISFAYLIFWGLKVVFLMIRIGWRSGLVAFSCFLGLALVPVPAFALSFLGITLFEDQDTIDADAVIADPQHYSVDFAIASGDDELKQALQSASSLYDGRDDVASGAAGLLATARGDYARLVAALYARGYYGGTVNIIVDGREATNLPPDSDLGDPAIVGVRVDAGPVYRFGVINIANQAASDTDLASDVGLITGEVARSGIVRRAARRALANWRALGHPKAGVADQAIVADHDNRRIDVSLDIAPGPPARFGAIIVEGAADVDQGFIRAQSGLKPGDPYRPAAIAEGKERLARLDVFNVIKIEEAETISPDGTLQITIIVQERRQRRLGAGATFSTTDGLGAETFWLHRNLFGRAESLRLDAKLAGIGYPLNTADFDYYFGGTFTKPGFGTADTDLVALLAAQRTVLKRYTQTSVEGKLGFTHRFDETFSADFGVMAKQANFEDTAYGSRDFTLAGVYGALTYDSRDSKVDATEGLFATLSAEPYYEFAYANPALLLDAEARTYFSFDADDRLVLAGRVRLGALLGPSIAETPPDKLFFSGGGGSVRGFAYRSIGIDGPGGSVTGGKFLTEGSLEARFKVTENIGVVGFVDAGYVTSDKLVGFAEGARIGVGGGLRYYTGFGPLRLDLAIPLNKRADDDNYALYVGIGQAF